MFKYMLLLALVAVLFVVAPGAAKPQFVYDYGYYAPAYVASYSAPLTYSYPYGYAYSYPFGYY